ncbi:MAG: hypothetical protein GTN40_03025 [Candidatus Aenigmarchaeota archaeon]|nr:hypothetical protein [Candidatus Aenigmarchaeota archaeon]
MKLFNRESGSILTKIIIIVVMIISFVVLAFLALDYLASTARRKTRDTARQQYVAKDIQAALESYYDNHKYYPRGKGEFTQLRYYIDDTQNNADDSFNLDPYLDDNIGDPDTGNLKSDPDVDLDPLNRYCYNADEKGNSQWYEFHVVMESKHYDLGSSKYSKKPLELSDCEDSNKTEVYRVEK